jgi:hypothetical protein
MICHCCTATAEYRMDDDDNTYAPLCEACLARWVACWPEDDVRVWPEDRVRRALRDIGAALERLRGEVEGRLTL